MNPETEKLISSVNEKLQLLTDIMFGEDGGGGLRSDVKVIKEKLIGNPDFKEEGLISIVRRHEEMYKKMQEGKVIDTIDKHDKVYTKMQNIGWFSFTVLSMGAAVGGFITWVAHNWHLLKKVINE